MKQKGFTLLEILLVIAAIGILAAIVIVAINPNRQLAQARNASRNSEVNSLKNALEQYLIDNGSYPPAVTTSLQDVCSPGNTGSCLDLESELVPSYLATIPVDPQAPSGESGYAVAINPLNNRISVEAKESELAEEIQINSEDYPIRSQFDVQVAYSLRRVSLAYSQPILRVRRASDNSEQDVSISQNGEIDWAAVESFSQGGDVFIRTWYDQSGNGINLNQGNITNQPQIIDSGAVITRNNYPSVYFDGVDDYLVSSANIAPGDRATLLVADYSMAAIDAEVFGIGRNTSYAGSYGLRRTLFLGWSNSLLTSGLTIPDNTGLELTEIYLTNDGTQIFRENTLSVSDSVIHTSSNRPLHLGARYNTQFSAESFIQEFIQFQESAQQYREEIVPKINTHYGL